MAATKLMRKFRKLVGKMYPCDEGKALIAKHDKFSALVKEASNSFKWWFIENISYIIDSDRLGAWDYCAAKEWASDNRTRFKKGSTIRQCLDRAHRLGVI